MGEICVCFFFNKVGFLKIINFLSLLCLCCCLWTFSSYGERKLVWGCSAQASRCRDFSCCGGWALESKLSSYSTWA